MIEHDHWALAATYTASSIVLGLLAVYLSTALVRRARVRS
jgi:CrcB protein